MTRSERKRNRTMKQRCKGQWRRNKQRVAAKRRRGRRPPSIIVEQPVPPHVVEIPPPYPLDGPVNVRVVYDDTDEAKEGCGADWWTTRLLWWIEDLLRAVWDRLRSAW